MKSLLRLTLLITALTVPVLQAQQPERWFQVEVSIFTHENLYPEAEHWEQQPDLSIPSGAQRLTELSQVLSLAEWTVNLSLDNINAANRLNTEPGAEIELMEPIQPPPPLPGPPPYNAANTFKLPDLERDPFILLPPQQSAFTDTNRTLERSPNHRLLYHALWRQPVRQAARSTPLTVAGGRVLGLGPGEEGQRPELHELGGTLRIRFNPAEDRVVLDANIWLLQPYAQPGEAPAIQMVQSREMRSNEFHYLDHPAMGIVVMVQPYTVPELESTEEQLPD